jgi:transposase InsO family protein
LALLKEAKEKGISEQKSCELLQIGPRRIRGWKSRPTLENGKPGPTVALHALLEEEKEQIIKLATDNRYIDDSHRILAVKASDAGVVQASASSFYRLMRKHDLTTARKNNRSNGNSQKPEREELNEPNKRWCWDISYLKTNVKGIFLYLYAVLDEYSRKVVAWRISWYLNHQEGKELIDDALNREGLTAEQIEQLILHNDRGVQMKAKGFKQMLKDLGMEQKFSRPRTPNDNPYIESAFSIVKGSPSYPLYFLDDGEAIAYFTSYFHYYNNERLHGRIGYVTPEQKHSGLSDKIIAEREKRKKEARTIRITHNKNNKNNLTEKNKCGMLSA